MDLRKSLNTALAVAALTTFASSRAAASDYRWGVLAGYGGEGVSAQVDSSSTNPAAAKTTGEKAEGPLVAGIFVERLISDTLLVGVEHTRGISMIPFSSGASLTGLNLRWYFFGAAPDTAPTSGDGQFFTKRIAPFVGVSTGLALADIYRGDDKKVPHITGSGAYFGIRGGVDYPLAPDHGIRPEFTMAGTSYLQSFSDAANPPVISQFALQCSWYFNF